MIAILSTLYGILSVVSPRNSKTVNIFSDKYFFDKRFASDEELTKLLQRVVFGISLLNFIILSKENMVYLKLSSFTYIFSLLFLCPKEYYINAIKYINSYLLYIYSFLLLASGLLWFFLFKFEYNSVDILLVNLQIIGVTIAIHISLLMFKYFSIIISKYSTILFKKYLFFCADYHINKIGVKPLAVFFVTIFVFDYLCVEVLPHIFSSIL